jgi:hypothetical protein
MKEVKKDLQALTRALKALTRDTERLAKKLDRLQKPKAAKKPKAKVKRKARPAKKRVTKKRAPQVSASETVLRIIKRSAKGVDTATLRKKTGFQGRKVRDILYRLKKQRKIRSPRKGVYIKTARA